MLAKLLNRTFCNRTKPYRTCIFGGPFGDPLKLDKIGFGAVYIVLGTLPIMPKFVTPMPLVIFRQLKSPGFYPLGGAKGLYLRIRGASEIYILRYQDTSGNRRYMSLGLRSSMSLSEARTKATAIHARLSKGINPSPKSTTRRPAKVHQSSKKAASASKSFAEVMDLWLKYRVETNYWVNDRKEPYATSNLLARHVLPHLGKVSINAITVEDIRDVLVPIWTTKTITAK